MIEVDATLRAAKRYSYAAIVMSILAVFLQLFALAVRFEWSPPSFVFWLRGLFL